MVHGFFGRKGGVSKGLFDSLNCSMRLEHGEEKDNVLENRSIACNTLGLSPAYLRMLKQVHSSKVCICNSHSEIGHNAIPQIKEYKERGVMPVEISGVEPELPASKNVNGYIGTCDGIEADALVTNQPNIAIAVQTADCTPILLADSKNKVIAAVHAGWRGAMEGIVENTIKAMIDLGAERDSIIAAIGPTIRQNNYEVSEEFKNNFLQKQNKADQFFRVERSQILFNLPAFCYFTLQQNGLKTVEDTGIDTYSNPNEFFSFRRSTHNGEKICGGQISIICLPLGK